jgi:DNA (cytosine-5)-methyltransferase 1
MFGDIRSFISEGYATAYTGLVDVLTAGFPCQPFSVCGHQQGEDDARNMWPSTIECLRIIRPRYAFMENVTGLLANGYIQQIFGDLADSGYDANWCVLGGYASDSCCEGERLWIVAAQTDSAVLESLDLSSDIFTCAEEPCRREFTRAIGAMFQQDDYTRIKRDRNAVAEGMERLKAIGNGQNPRLAAKAWGLLSSYNAQAHGEAVHRSIKCEYRKRG